MTEKEHYTNFHWGDWFKDTASLRSSTRGIWLDMIGEMARRGSDRLHAQFERLPFVLRDTQMGIMLAAIELAENDTAIVLLDNKPILLWRNELHSAGISEQDWITNHMAKAYLTVICRRRTKELDISNKRSTAGRKGMASRWQSGNKGDNKPNNTDVTTHGSGSGSGSGNGITGKGSPEGEPATAKPDPASAPPPATIHPNGLPAVEEVVTTGPAFTRAQFDLAGKQMLVDPKELDNIWNYLGSQGWRWSNGCGLGVDPRSVIHRCMAHRERQKQQGGGASGGNRSNTNRPDRAEGTANADKHDSFKRPLGVGGLGYQPAAQPPAGAEAGG